MRPEIAVFIYILSGIIAFFLVCLLSFFLIVFHYLKMLVHPQKRTFEELIEYEVKEKNFNRKWLEIPFLEMRTTSVYGYNLFGRFYQKKNHNSSKIMISLHGHNSCSVSQMKYLDMFFEGGFNVFIPDHRYSGFSEGPSVTFGIKEKTDVITWMDVLQEKYPEAEFYVFGESMGAATGIMVSAEDKRVKKLVEYCGFANIPTLMKQHIKNDFLIYKLFWPAMRLLCKIVYRFDLGKSDPLGAIEKISVPVLIMHSKADSVVGYENAMLLKNAKMEADFVSFSDSIHARSMVKYPEEFKGAVLEFLSRD